MSFGRRNTSKEPHMKPITLVLLMAAFSGMFVFAAGCTTPAIPGITTPTASPTPTPEETLVVCGMENCHGTEIQCGSNPVDVCTAVFSPGDQCRKYASCQVISGTCQPVYEAPFERCKNCIEMCASQYKDSPMLMSDCEQKC